VGCGHRSGVARSCLELLNGIGANAGADDGYYTIDANCDGKRRGGVAMQPHHHTTILPWLSNIFSNTFMAQ
jgi:hypothetical protein